jgi:hypothetical protein
VIDALGTIAGLGIANSRFVAESLRASLLSALGGDDWHEIAAEYGRRFMSDPPSVFQSQLAGDLMILRQSLDWAESQAARLAAPRLMTLQGMAIANKGDVATAARWYRAARIAADRSEDHTLRQWVRGREAFRRGYEGASPGEVLAIAYGVHDIEAYLSVAQAYARIGEVSRALTELSNARRIHEVTDQSETTIYSMPPWRMALSSAYVYALMGDVDQCNRELDQVAPPASVKRWEAQLEIQRAVAYARAGEIKLGRETARNLMHSMPKEERSIVVLEMSREAMTPESRPTRR